jgi:glycosyltransferase involved in cell wall biosynthesis
MKKYINNSCLYILKMVEKKKKTPLVSVCTPTFNRRPFIPIMLECFRNQNYPKDRIEWIIVDDGTDKIADLIEKANIPQIKYFSLDKKMSLGEKRNYMHKQSTGSIIVYMDDDDYYPPERISHAVERLTSSPTALCAGSSEMYIYFKHIKKMYQCGPYGPNHATAGTFAFKKELLSKTQYENHAALAEEKAFLKNYTIPFVQLDPMKTILVFSHEHNTFDKRELLKNPHPDVFKESPKTVDMFIKFKDEEHIKKFFMKDIDKLLAKYEPGLPKMKPDVLKQIKEIDAERAKMMQEQNANGPIMLQQPGKEPVALSSQDVVNMIQQQQQQINSMSEYIKQLEMSKNINSSPFMPTKSPFAPPSPFVQPFSNTSELEKENNELKEKYNNLYNEIQRYKVMIESQKCTIEKLKKASTSEQLEKHVKFQQNPYVVFG